VILRLKRITYEDHEDDRELLEVAVENPSLDLCILPTGLKLRLSPVSKTGHTMSKEEIQ